MKTVSKILFVFLSIMLVACGTQQTPEGQNESMTKEETSPSVSESNEVLTKLWETDQSLLTPESVLYDKERNVLYVANINGNPTDKDGNGFISKLSPEGEILSLKWVEGLNAPKGMGVYRNKLYVSDIDEIIEINIDEGKVSDKYGVENAQFLNDIVVSEAGEVFVTDMNDNKIYELSGGVVSLYMENGLLERPNGLLFYEGKLLAGTKSLIAVDPETREATKFSPETESTIDGIVEDNQGNIFFSHWSGRIFKFTPNKELTQVLSTADKNIQSADIGIIAGKNVLLVPTFTDNRVVAYQINN